MDMMNHVVIAYIDPGSGSLIIQAVIGSILGAAFLLKSYLKAGWRKMTSKSK